MLKTALVAMTIVGCDCDAKLCEFVSETPAHWASVADCESAIRAQVVRSPGVDYPLVTGICRPLDPEGIDTTQVESQLASLENEDAHSLYEIVLETGGAMWRRTTDGYDLVKAGLVWTADRVTPTAVVAWLPGAD